MKYLIFATMLSVLSACYSVQTTSGDEYLRRGTTKAFTDVDRDVRTIAAVEPTLTFPARIGLARIVNGQLDLIPENEGRLWKALAGDNRDVGAFVAVDPLVAEFALHSLPSATPRSGRAELTRKIRLGAARQHLDAVLVYEVGTTSSDEYTMLGFAELSIVGAAFLPTRRLGVEAQVKALLMDVRSGYPYGTAQAAADVTELAAGWGSRQRKTELRHEISQIAVKKLTPEVDAMFDELVRQRRGR